MGARGPQKTPTPILAARGSKRAKYDRRDEPTVANERIEAPPGLSDAARPYWDWAVERLYELGVLSRHATHTIARYAECMARWRRESNFLAKAGTDVRWVTLPDGTKEPKTLPHVKSVAVLCAELLRIEREFGFTPASRPNLVGADQPIEDDPLSAILAARRSMN
jgi:P27 family predicted phage terminase small subunit